MFVGEAEPNMPHLRLILLPIVGLHIDHDQSASRLEHAQGLTEYLARIRRVVKSQDENRSVELLIVYGEAFEISATKIDILVGFETTSGRREHGPRAWAACGPAVPGRPRYHLLFYFCSKSNSKESPNPGEKLINISVYIIYLISARL